jgi:hypothetical protein
MPTLVAEEPIRRFYVSDDIGTRVSDYQCRKQSETTQDPATLLWSMTRKGEWRYSQRSVVLAKAGKERAMREALASGWGHPRSRLRRKTYPSPRSRAKCGFGPPLLSSGISMDLVRSRFP